MTDLPCFPCPYRSACCRWGTWLTESEGVALHREFGPAFVFRDLDTGRWRTQVLDGRCKFCDGGCAIHSHPEYPTMCRDFPHKDTMNPLAPRAFDAISCPHVAL